ncbi:MAG: hypothetical protein OXM58_02515 [Rhodospirillaceae bacterium]|nr:hypothetical protein [Rhodospirillaceae bacterium]
MDATLVAAASRPPPYKAGAGAGHAREPGADWTRKKGRAFFGYPIAVIGRISASTRVPG